MSPLSSISAHSIAAVLSHHESLSAGQAGAPSHASFDGDWCGTKPPHPPIPHLGASLLERIGLNPQPLPPAGRDVGWCGTVPRHFPPPPPPVGPLAQLLGKVA